MTTTIQQTAKKFKLLMLLGAVVIFLGACIVFTPGGQAIGGFTLLLGLALIIWGRIGKWWHHE